MQARITALFISLAIAAPLIAQDLSLTLLPEYTMRIAGTSNVRDWDADVTTIEIDFALQNMNTWDLADLKKEMFNNLTLRIPVADISSKTRGLTGKVQKYLKKEQHPFITFQLKHVTDIQLADSSALIKAEGVINAAGKDHYTTLDATLSTSETGPIVISGSTTLHMTSFDIDPPTALLGSIRAVDKFEIHFTLPFAPPK